MKLVKIRVVVEISFAMANILKSIHLIFLITKVIRCNFFFI